jgi:hypothetical protein
MDLLEEFEKKKKNPTWTNVSFCQFCDASQRGHDPQEELAKFD